MFTPEADQSTHLSAAQSELSVAAVITFCRCVVTGCGYVLQAEGVFTSLLLVPHILQYGSEGKTSSSSEAASVQLTAQTCCFIAHQLEGCDRFLESMVCPPAGG